MNDKSTIVSQSYFDLLPIIFLISKDLLHQSKCYRRQVKLVYVYSGQDRHSFF